MDGASSFEETIVALAHDPDSTRVIDANAPLDDAAIEWHRFSVTASGFVGWVTLMVEMDPGPARFIHAPSVRITDPSSTALALGAPPRRLEPTARQRAALRYAARPQPWAPPPSPGGSFTPAGLRL